MGEPDHDVRIDLLDHVLRDMIEAAEVSEIDTAAVDDIAGLLYDPNFWVMGQVVFPLIMIGPPANRAVPSLEQALARAIEEERRLASESGDNVVFGLQTSDLICGAFIALAAESPPANCVDGRYTSRPR